MTAAERTELIRMLRRWCLDLNVDAYAKSVLHVLIQYVDANGECRPSLGRIAREAGMSRRKAVDVVRTLAEAGILDVRRSTGRIPHRYTLSRDPARYAPSNNARRAELQCPNPAHKAELNTAQRAGFEDANPAPHVAEPCTPCIPLVRNGREDAGQAGNSPDSIGSDIDLREVEA